MRAANVAAALGYRAHSSVGRGVRSPTWRPPAETEIRPRMNSGGGRWATWAGRALRRAAGLACCARDSCVTPSASSHLLLNVTPGALRDPGYGVERRWRKDASVAPLIRCADQNSTLRTSGPECGGRPPRPKSGRGIRGDRCAVVRRRRRERNRDGPGRNAKPPGGDPNQAQGRATCVQRVLRRPGSSGAFIRRSRSAVSNLAADCRDRNQAADELGRWEVGDVGRSGAATGCSPCRPNLL